MDVNGVTGWSMGIDNSDGDKFKIANSWSDPGANTRLTIDGAGNMGIGIATPSEKLQVEAGSVFINGEGEGLIVDAGGSKRVGLMKWAGMNTSIMHGSTVPITFGQTSDPDITASNNFYVEQMRIDNSGNVGIGITGPNDKLDINGYVRSIGYRTRNGINGVFSGNVFNFNWSGTQLHGWVDGVFIGAGVTSDRRLKDRINTMQNTALNRVMALRPVDFYYKKLEGTIFTGSPEQQEGFIADELQQVIPSAVTGVKDAVTKDGAIQPQTLNVMPVVSVLTKAVQEQQVMIDEQQKLINALMREVKELKGNTGKASAK
jgi:hypothetical protein